MNSVTLRKVPGAVVLGLLASLGAHAALYGGDHAMGGPYHDLLAQIAIVGVGAALAIFGALAWAQSCDGADGTVLAVRLREMLPNFPSVVTAAAVWYAAAESLEPRHAAASLVFCIGTLALASVLAVWFARCVASAVTHAVITVSRNPFAPRVLTWQRRPRAVAFVHRPPQTRRRFARPPPILAASFRA